MKRVLASAALSVLLAASFVAPAVAQVQLADEVANQLAELGIDQTLIVSEDQLLQIEAVLNENAPDTEKVTRINTILNE